VTGTHKPGQILSISGEYAFTGKLARPHRDGVKSRRIRFVNENPVVDSQVTGVQQPAEKLLPQTEVNSLVGAAKQKGHERGYQQAMQEFQQQQQNAGMNQQAAQAQQTAIPNQPMAANPDDVRRIAAEEFARQQQAFQQAQEAHQQTMRGQQIFNDLQSKFAAAKATNPDIDFNATMNEFQNAPDILALASTVDNSPDVIQHIRENPSKMAQIRMMPENFAKTEMKKISDSIKQNQQALASPKIPEPLSQIRPSSVGVGNSEGSGSYHAQYKGQY
jgi:hypothetical protein